MSNEKPKKHLPFYYINKCMKMKLDDQNIKNICDCILTMYKTHHYESGDVFDGNLTVNLMNTLEELEEKVVEYNQYIANTKMEMQKLNAVSRDNYVNYILEELNEAYNKVLQSPDKYSLFTNYKCLLESVTFKFDNKKWNKQNKIRWHDNKLRDLEIQQTRKDYYRR